jgi:maleate cis-trans isomerase
MATKAELLEILDSERWRALGIALDRLENQNKSEVADLQKELKELKSTLDAIKISVTETKTIQVFRILEKSTWKERIAILSPILAIIFLSYCLAASIPPAEAIGDLLYTAQICFQRSKNDP